MTNNCGLQANWKTALFAEERRKQWVASATVWRVFMLPVKVATVSSSVPSSDAKLAVRSAASSSIWELSALFTTEYLERKTGQN